jgi:mono/diheme cytochrome c family protein
VQAILRHWPRVLLAAFLFQNAVLAYPHVRDVIVRPETTDYETGRAVAVRLGCFGCHGPDGRGGVPNPGSEWKTVPAFTERVPMMFASTDAELREYILDGRPASKASDPKHDAEMKRQAIRMPAYRALISGAELEAVVAFIRTASGLLYPEEELAARGMDIALTSGCFACHGDMGGGGVANPGSLKGYVPGFWGQDFSELVRDDDELIEWIREGRIARLAGNPIARRFLETQVIQMPAYKTFLDPDEIEAVAAAVRWINQGTWRHAPLLE